MKLSRELRGVTCNSREVEPGFAFVAIQGLKRDGHEFIEDALSRGASFIITEKPVKVETHVPIHQVKDGRVALAQVAAALNGHPSQSLQCIGVTGTNGKTTTTFLLHHLLNQNGIGCGLIGTVDIDTGLHQRKARLTTPDAVELQRYLREMVDAGLKAVSMEVSSHGIELKRTYGVDFDLAIFTNISDDHFDFHKSFEGYLKIKKSLFEQLPPNAIALINKDDQHGNYIAEGLQAQVVTYGVERPATITAEAIRKDNIKTYYDLVVHEQIESKYARLQPMRLPIEIKMPGKHNIYNTLAACGGGLLMGLSPNEVQNIGNFFGVWRRLNVIHNKEFIVIDDCAHNPGSYTAVFETVRDLRFNNLYIINAIRGNRGVQINQDNARVIAQWVKKLPHVRLMITNCTDLARQDDAVTPDEEHVFLQTLRDHGVAFEHRQELKSYFDNVLEEVRPGDLVLLLGAHAMDEAGELMGKYLYLRSMNSCTESL